MQMPDYANIDWLLEENDPSVRYRTLTELLDEPSDSQEACEAKAQIPNSEPVKEIFLKMHPEGYWYYVNKNSKKGGRGDGVRYWDFVTTHYNLAFLSELGMDRNHPRIDLATNRYLRLQKDDGDFLGHYSCLFGYNLRTFLRMGYRDDPRVGKIIDLMLSTDRPDGGYLCDKYEYKWKKKIPKSCIHGSVKALIAFSELPDHWDSSRCKCLIHYFLKRHVLHRTGKPLVPLRGYLNTSFPMVVRPNLIEPLYALSVMGYGAAPELTEAWNILETKKNEEGRYVLDWDPPRSYFKPGKRGEPSKWLTLYAYLALKYR